MVIGEAEGVIGLRLGTSIVCLVGKKIVERGTQIAILATFWGLDGL